MQHSKPSGSPPPTPRMGCFYRGPILLGLDPTYNLNLKGVSPTLDPFKLSNPTLVQAGLTFLEPFLLVEVHAADGTSEYAVVKLWSATVSIPR